MNGRAGVLWGGDAERLAEVGQRDWAGRIRDDVVGRNVLDGRWTFQVVAEFDELYHEPVVAAVRELERHLQGGRRHVFEARMKEERRSIGRAGHEHRPPSSHDPRVETDRDD